MSDKDERLKLHSAWILEWAELETVFKRKDVAATKAFLSCASDSIRPPYGRETVTKKKQKQGESECAENISVKDGESSGSPKNETEAPGFRHGEEVGSGFNRLQYFLVLVIL